MHLFQPSNFGCISGVTPNTTLSNCSNQCAHTCLTKASPEICNDDESSCMYGCICEHGLVFDSSCGSCVPPEACACYDPVCNVHIENGTINATTCCPDRQWYVHVHRAFPNYIFHAIFCVLHVSTAWNCLKDIDLMVPWMRFMETPSTYGSMQ